MAARPLFTPDWREPLFAALREIPVVQYACDAVGVDRSTVFRHRQDDPEFAKAFQEAMEAGIDKAEQEAFRRAVVGFEEPVVYKGELTPVWARDAEGVLILKDVELSDGTIDRRPVQAVDAQGRPVWLTVRKHSDAMLALILKGRRKAVYAERTEITGADGGPQKTAIVIATGVPGPDFDPESVA